MMRRSAVFVFLLLLLTEFNNCGNLSDHPGFGYSSSLAACDPPDPNQIYNPNAPAPNVDCTQADNQYMRISPVGGDIALLGQQGDFDIAGTCNGGGYAHNSITWQLRDSNGILVRNSGMLDLTSHNGCVAGTFKYGTGTTYNTTCKNGSFQSHVTLYCLQEDPVNRSGGANGYGTTSPYTLTMVITGYDANNQAYQNSVFGFRVVNINPPAN